ncbi:hypothetical protein [Nostoc cycadae]|nr:hypothetical protein [Nostoc cycadae]
MTLNHSGDAIAFGIGAAIISPLEISCLHPRMGRSTKLSLE